MKKSDFSADQWQILLEEIKEKLIDRAKKFKPITYGGLCRQLSTFKLEPQDEALYDALGEISKSEYEAGRGLLSVFCGGNRYKNRLPGGGFFWEVNNLGISYIDKDEFVRTEREKIHKIYGNQTS